ncbi:ferrous iron transport protein B [Kordia periserrulae]|uniref:Ferrous iron transport protein B n=1 Tax=Kordia periserrulae TaxID=701523 RepID=A0A2T6C766_9FLAO|nr:ferrous iron transport protein B [Kordia periserrulae]PTX64126.1 ferrous iron transport protein B [Kordia periserrulae]
MSDAPIQVALIGNPNTGKTSLFNHLTGLNQKVGNYPGITVDKKTGTCKLSPTQKATILDLPGTYSLNASSVDEKIAIDILNDTDNELHPDVAIVVADVEQLKRNLLIFTQVKDLEIPTILVINMADRMQLKGISVDIEQLEADLQTKVVIISSKQKTGIDDVKKAILAYKSLSTERCISKEKIKQNTITDTSLLTSLSASELKKVQHRETIVRYQFINDVLKKSYVVDRSKASDTQAKLDRIFTHKIFGYVIFGLLLLLIFQVIFEWSSVPMELIDGAFGSFAEWTKEVLPKGMLTNLLADGIIAGLGGIVIFIPQIAFLFLFISILEESGYMSRVVFLMDKIMRRFGLSGKSIVPLISGAACAIPAIMATRNIESWKERLITILVTPFITCSARLPVYAILISLIIPNERVFWFFNWQGITLMLLYLIGFAIALISAFILHKTLKIQSKSYFVVELPKYKVPLVKNVAYTVLEKTKTFVFEAGKIILAISIILWVLGSVGVNDKFHNAETIVQQAIEKNGFTEIQEIALENKIIRYTESVREEAEAAGKTVNVQEMDAEVAEKIPEFREAVIEDEIEGMRLENSILGVIGKTIEPVIQPLGYDWKIGIALVSSFAAREVFIGTLATIYSVGSEGDDEAGNTIKAKMQAEVHASSGKKVFNFASGISLLLFYAFAMQCMSTLAIVKRETKGWKWPMVQLFSMTIIAYVAALIAYQFLK